jgi:hypothetical protein
LLPMEERLSRNRVHDVPEDHVAELQPALIPGNREKAPRPITRDHYV